MSSFKLSFLFTISMAAFFVFGGCSPKQLNETQDKDGMLQTEADFREKVAELRRDKKRIENAIERASRKKRETVEFLKEKGVTRSSKITDDSEIKYALKNLVSWKAEIKKYQDQVTKYDDTINSIMAMLEKLERDRLSDEVSLTDDQRVELKSIILDLEDRLDINDDDILQQMEWAEALDEENLENQTENSKSDRGNSFGAG